MDADLRSLERDARSGDVVALERWESARERVLPVGKFVGPLSWILQREARWKFTTVEIAAALETGLARPFAFERAFSEEGQTWKHYYRSVGVACAAGGPRFGQIALGLALRPSPFFWTGVELKPPLWEIVGRHWPLLWGAFSTNGDDNVEPERDKRLRREMREERAVLWATNTTSKKVVRCSVEVAREWIARVRLRACVPS